MAIDLERHDMLIARIQHVLFSNGFKQISSQNIHPKQVPFLLTINDNEGISQRELAKKLHVTPPTVAVSVKRLRSAGFIIKEDDGKDARVSRLYLTPMAKETLENAKNTIDEDAEKMLLGFTEDEKEQFKSFLLRILSNLGPMDAGCANNCSNEQYSSCDNNRIEEGCEIENT